MALRYIVAAVLAVLGAVPVVVGVLRQRRGEPGRGLALAVSGGVVALVAAAALVFVA